MDTLPYLIYSIEKRFKIRTTRKGSLPRDLICLPPDHLGETERIQIESIE
jgi:hypothetical protein